MSDIALRIEGLAKRYRLGSQENDTGRFYRYKSLRSTLSSYARHPLQTLTSTLLREPMTEDNSFWALKDISFEVKKGDVVGIIGRNGAGKSTLLKILSRITKPTTGRVDLFGRVGSLLEVGTGFHPELTGRENIYQNGAILGMTRAEVKAKFDEIVFFSEIEKFLDTPVKQYSSGMYMRLAFAVAAHLEPEILLVDEVLAVGDFAFQQKCLGKMKEVSTHGRTVLFVSHSMAAIRQLCSCCYLLNRGMLIEGGPTDQVLTRYLRQGSLAKAEYILGANDRPIGNEVIVLQSVAVTGSNSTSGPTFAAEESLDISIGFQTKILTRGLRIGYRLHAVDGTCLFTSTDADFADDCHHMMPRAPGSYLGRCRIPPYLLRPGDYSISVGSDIPGIQANFLAEHIVSFSIEFNGRVNNSLRDSRLGAICPSLAWQLHESA